MQQVSRYCVWILLLLAPSTRIDSQPPVSPAARIRSQSVPAISGESSAILRDLENQLMPQKSKKCCMLKHSSSRPSLCSYLKALTVAALALGAGWAIRDITNVVHKVDIGVDNLADTFETIRDRLDQITPNQCPPARQHFERMLGALIECHASLDESREPCSSYLMLCDDDTTSISSCPAARLHFGLMLTALDDCMQDRSYTSSPLAVADTSLASSLEAQFTVNA